MGNENIVVSEVQGVTTVTLKMTSLLDGPVIEDVGRCLFVLVEEKAIRKLIVDFRNVGLLSSSTLGILVSLQKKIAAIEGRVILCGMRPSLMKVFKITNLDRILTFAKDESQAMKKLKSL